jgi:hypothetical protein
MNAVAEEIGFVGREREASQMLSAIQRGQKVLVSGGQGVGKSALLRYVHDDVKQHENVLAVWVPDGNTKDVLLALAEQCHQNIGLKVPPDIIPKQSLSRAKRQGFIAWKDLQRPLRRLNNKALGDVILNSISDGKRDALLEKRCVVFIESLEMPAAQIEFVQKLFGATQIVAAVSDSNRRANVKRLTWSFQTRIELRPLDLKASEQIAEDWLKKNPVRFSDKRTKDRFVRHVGRDSGGNPEAIAGMLAHAATEDEVTPAKANKFSHEASETYLDMTPFVLIGVIVLMAMRYISRGMSETELMIISGVGSALFFGGLFLLRALRDKKR